MTASGSAEQRGRVDWLDGIRGAAALYVVVHHMWLSVWTAFPRNAGPWWTGWLLYGHLAVAVFIVVSGFSLSMSPLRHGATLAGGARRFLRRRAWRILPPYWVALVFSTIIAALVLEPNAGLGAISHGVLINGLLLQDVLPNVTPNGSFWSIAIEWQIYFTFPLILWLARKTTVAKAVLCAVLAVLVAHGLAALGKPLSKIDHVTPQFLALFALGVLAVYLGHDDRAARLRRPLSATGMTVLGALAALAIAEGSPWMVANYFWVDIAFGAAVACLLAVMYGGGLPRTRRVLASPVSLKIGLFSYSLYLVHGPLVDLLRQKVLGPMHLAPLATFGLMLAIGLPIILALSYGFHLMFEAPFLEHRDRSSLAHIPGLGRLVPRRAVNVPAVAPPGPVVGISTEGTV